MLHDAGANERCGSKLSSFEPTGVSGADLDCTSMSRTVAEKAVFLRSVDATWVGWGAQSTLVFSKKAPSRSYF